MKVKDAVKLSIFLNSKGEKYTSSFFYTIRYSKMKLESPPIHDGNLKNYRDWQSVIETSYKDGRLDEKLEIAKKMLLADAETEFIVQMTGLSSEQIEDLKNKAQ